MNLIKTLKFLPFKILVCLALFHSAGQAASIQKIYVALFGRPADPAGLAYFSGVTKNGSDLSAIGELASSAEYTDRFQGKSKAEIVNSIYQNLFGRDAESAGLNFFVDALNAGTLNINNIAIAIIDGAQGADLAVVNNKVAAAQAFTDSLNTPGKISAYSGSAAAETARNWLAGVTDEDSLAKATANIPNMTSGTTTYTLTTGVDSFAGTAGDDNFKGVLSSLDNINGGAGNDKLVIQSDPADSASGITINNIEIVQLPSGATIEKKSDGGVVITYSNGKSSSVSFSPIPNFVDVNGSPVTFTTPTSIKFTADSSGTGTLTITGSNNNPDIKDLVDELKKIGATSEIVDGTTTISGINPDLKDAFTEVFGDGTADFTGANLASLLSSITGISAGADLGGTAGGSSASPSSFIPAAIPAA